MRRVHWIVLLAALLIQPPDAGANDIVILASSDIIQFTACIDGIRATLSDHSIRQIVIDRSVKKAQVRLKEMTGAPPSAVIGVGTQAARALAETTIPGSARAFCMVLDPEEQFADVAPIPGVSLNIPTGFQLQQIRSAFPQRTRIGIFFNPAFNRARVDEFKHEAAQRDLTIVELPVEAERDIAAQITSDDFQLDVLLIIPDLTLRSPRIIEYIIRESIRRTIPVVGYNSWFAQSGAVLSFIIDYGGVGRQTGRLVRRLLSEEVSPEDSDAGIESPENIRITINARTAERLGIAINPEFLHHAHEVIR